MLVVTVGFKGSLQTAKSYATCSGVCSLAVDKMWRVLVGTIFVSLVQACLLISCTFQVSAPSQLALLSITV